MTNLLTLEEIVLSTINVELEMDKALLVADSQGENVAAVVPIDRWRSIASLLAHIQHTVHNDPTWTH